MRREPFGATREPFGTKARATRKRIMAVLVALCAIGLIGAGCGDGTPDFCHDLAEAKNLDGITSALKSDDLGKAATEARELKEISEKAPPEIRSDLVALADGVADIIDLVRSDREAGSISNSETSTSIGPSEVERRREELNERLDTLDKRSSRVSDWATEQCGLKLS